MMRLLPTMALAAALPLCALAQAQTGFGSGGQDTGEPVEMSAETLSISDDGARNVMVGNVVIGQGDMRLAADRVEIEQAGGEISLIIAIGNVVITQAGDAAEADRADYEIASGTVVLTGDVLLSRAGSVTASDRADIDLNTGAADLTGNVRAVLESE